MGPQNLAFDVAARLPRSRMGPCLFMLTTGNELYIA